MAPSLAQTLVENATHSNSVDIPKVAPPMGKHKHTRLLIPETTPEESSKNLEHVTAWLYMLPILDSSKVVSGIKSLVSSRTMGWNS